MTEEFNLSKKREGSIKSVGCSYPEEDVKEFIRLLKEEIERGVKRNKIFPLDWCFDSIDELAGEQLTK